MTWKSWAESATLQVLCFHWSLVNSSLSRWLWSRSKPFCCFALLSPTWKTLKALLLKQKFLENSSTFPPARKLHEPRHTAPPAPPLPRSISVLLINNQSAGPRPGAPRHLSPLGEKARGTWVRIEKEEEEGKKRQQQRSGRRQSSIYLHSWSASLQQYRS